MDALPMFPLGTVLFPGMVLPLHVFEERYRALVDVCLAGEGRFGVVLIERGHEVGGGDVRTDVGSEAAIVEATPFPDGRWALVVVGTRRLEVERWLDDDPFPRALVRYPDEGTAFEQPPAGLVAEAEAAVRRALALAAELGEAVAPLDTAIGDDPEVAPLRLAALAPLGPLDRQRLLAEADPTARTARLLELLRDRVELLETRLAAG